MRHPPFEGRCRDDNNDGVLSPKKETTKNDTMIMEKASRFKNEPFPDMEKNVNTRGVIGGKVETYCLVPTRPSEVRRFSV